MGAANRKNFVVEEEGKQTVEEEKDAGSLQHGRLPRRQTKSRPRIPQESIFAAGGTQESINLP